MIVTQRSSWLARRLQAALRSGLTGAYRHIKVDPNGHLLHLCRAYGLRIQSFRQMFYLRSEVIEHIAAATIRAASKLAALEGAGLGVGGLITIVPDLGLLSAITYRMIQKLSLTYGFEYSTEEEVAELWVATASAAGVDLAKDMVDRGVIERFVPRVIQRVAAKAGTEVAEKWAGRMVPLLSSATGATLNYYFVREWGRRAQRHFRERHRMVRSQLEATPALVETRKYLDRQSDTQPTSANNTTLNAAPTRPHESHRERSSGG